MRILKFWGNPIDQFSFTASHFLYLFKAKCASLRLKNYCFFLFFKICIDSRFYIYVPDHIKRIGAFLWIKGCGSFYHSDTNCSSTICWKAFYFAFNFIGIYLNNQIPTLVWVYIWSPYSVPLIYLSVFMLIMDWNVFDKNQSPFFRSFWEIRNGCMVPISLNSKYIYSVAPWTIHGLRVPTFCTVKKIWV